MNDEIVYRWDGPPSIELRRRQVVLPSGLSYPAHWLVTGDGRPGVVVCALCDGALLLAGSRRPAVGRDLWELPRGFCETSDWPPVTDALRELREETGYLGHSPKFEGEYVTDSSVLPTKVAVISCRVASTASLEDTDGEVNQVRWVPLSDIAGLIADGTIADAHSLAALTYLVSLWALGTAS